MSNIKGTKRRSPVWANFSDYGSETAKCNYCCKIISYKGGSIYNLSRHMSKKHSAKALTIVPLKQNVSKECSDIHLTVDENQEIGAVVPSIYYQGAITDLYLSQHDIPTSQEVVLSSNAGTKRRNQSPVWGHFSRPSPASGKCNYCKKLISIKGGITNLARHLRLKHSAVALDKPSDALQQIVRKECPEILPTSDSSHEVYSEAPPIYYQEIVVLADGQSMSANTEENKSESENFEDFSSSSKAVDKILLQPFNYIEQVPGKQIRTKLTKAFNLWLNIPLDKCQEIGEIVQMLHNASLLVDDIEDNSKLRRGVPVAHHIFGVASTINSANYVYFLALEKTLKLGHPKATSVYTEQLLELHRGQGMEIYWRDNFICPTEQEYKEMVKRKTGGLFGLGVQLMQLFSENKSDFTKIIAIMGLYFQIRDDYANLQSKEYTENKSYCEDLTEGKFSFPVIHSIRKTSDDPRIMNIIRQRTTDVEIKKYAVSIMKKNGSFEYSRTVLKDLEAQAREEIQNLGHNSYLIAVLDELRLC